MDRESERSKRSKEIFGDPDDYIEPNSSNINISGHPDGYIVTMGACEALVRVIHNT